MLADCAAPPFYQLRQLRVIRKSIPTRACTQLVHALVNSRLDYCNRLLSGVTDQLLMQPTSIGTESLRAVGTSTAKVRSCLQRHPGVQHLRSLRSAAHGNLHIPRTRTRTLGPRSFSVSGPCSWNSLPANLKKIELTLQVFKSQLKTRLFHQAYGQ